MSWSFGVVGATREEALSLFTEAAKVTPHLPGHYVLPLVVAASGLSFGAPAGRQVSFSTSGHVDERSEHASVHIHVPSVTP